MRHHVARPVRQDTAVTGVAAGILQAELDTVEENLEVLRQQGKNVSRAMLKGLEKRKHNLVAKLEKVEHAIKSRTDDVVDFKQMGIDHIFIDESHQFKNLTFNTRHDRVAGLGNIGRKPESPEYALCHAYYTGTYG